MEEKKKVFALDTTTTKKGIMTWTRNELEVFFRFYQCVWSVVLCTKILYKNRPIFNFIKSSIFCNDISDFFFSGNTLIEFLCRGHSLSITVKISFSSQNLALKKRRRIRFFIPFSVPSPWKHEGKIERKRTLRSIMKGKLLDR